jgi:hypothetical protein
MKILNTINKFCLAGLTFTYLASALSSAQAANGKSSFETFSKETEEKTAYTQIDMAEFEESDNGKFASIPAFLSETYVRGVYSDGCDTFETAAYEGRRTIYDANEYFGEEQDFTPFAEAKKATTKPVARLVMASVVQIVAKPSVPEYARIKTQHSEDSETFSLAYNSNGFGGSDAISDKSLSETRGASLQVVGQTIGAAVLTANAVGNSATNSVTGANTVTSDAFGSASGVVSLIQNSGNNVIIQSATVVNLQLQ